MLPVYLNDNIHCIMEKVREFQENIYFCLIDYTKAFDCVDHNKLWKILKEMRIPDHLTCLLRNLFAGQEATAITRHGTMDWFQNEKGVQCSSTCSVISSSLQPHGQQHARLPCPSPTPGVKKLA